MRWPQATKLRRLARRVVQCIAPGSLILLYHRVAESSSDPWSLCVSPRHFAEHLDVLRGRVLPLVEICKNQAGRTREGGPIAITFDDGYADVLHAARPLLEGHDLPATVFVATGGVDDGRPFWWDELSELFAPERKLPVTLELDVRGEGHRFELDQGSDQPNGGTAHCRRETWTGSRARLHHELHNLLGGLDGESRREQLVALHRWANVDRSPITIHRGLTRDEIVRLAADGLVEIGAHTVSHPRLSALEPFDQEREIQDSQMFLSTLVGRPITSFAYPHGCHDLATRRILRESGFKRACATQFGTVRRSTDALRLPRLEVPDCDGEAFNKILRRLAF